MHAGALPEGRGHRQSAGQVSEAMVELVYSVNGVPIRLTDERWAHITNNKP